MKAKAAHAEAVEVATVAAIARGEMAAPRPAPLQLVKHLVLPGDDLTDLAVKYGSSVASIKAANRRIVFEVLDNVLGQEITIPATRVPVDTPRDPAEVAEAAQRNQQFFARRSFQAKAKATEAEASFYLEENEWDVEAALAQWQDDVDWEKAQKKLPAGAGGGKSNRVMEKSKQRESQPLFGAKKK